MTEARLTPHARQRAAEMGIRTKRVKALVSGRAPGVRFADIKYRGGRTHVRGTDFTAVYTDCPDDIRVVVTVLWNHEFTRSELLSPDSEC